MITAIIQTRIGSKRLPGKVLKEINGKPMIWHVVNRLKKSKKIDEIILAIPDTEENDILKSFCVKNNISFFSGSEENVLSRYYKAAKKNQADTIVRITSDCPLIDTKIVDAVIQKHIKKRADYTSNIFKRTFPRGWDTEVFSFRALEKAHREAKENYQKEHVTPYIWKNPSIFKIRFIEAPKELNYPEIRLTVDTREDLELIRIIFYNLGYDCSAKEIIQFLIQNPRLLQINKNIRQKEIQNNIFIKKVGFGDIRFLWRLRNEPESRKYFYNKERVKFLDHLKWIAPIILRVSSKKLYVIKENKMSVGQIRMDNIINKKFKISISLLKDFQGKGIGKKSLLLLTRNGAEELIAEVYEKNIASKRLFEGQGFKIKNKKNGLLEYIWLKD